MDLGLEGRVAIVGGGSKGIGRATAMMLAAEGTRVVIAARGQPALDEAATTIAAATSAPPLAVRCDMAVYDDIKTLVARTVDAFGRIDIVVNNAGGPPFGRFEQQDDAAWQQALDQNVMSIVRLTREALPYLKQSDQPRIINITRPR